MATLRNKQTQKTIILHVNHTFGRDAESNTTTLHSPSASRNHATVAWNNETWMIKDSSTNGTYIDKIRIGHERGRFHEIPKDGQIQFGDIPAETWEVVDLTPPITGLIPLVDGLEFIPLHDVHVLPIDQIEIMVHLSEHGQWLCEINNEASVLNSGDKVGSHGKFWQFVDARPAAIVETLIVSPPPDDIKFRFSASRNEEHISLALIVNDEEHDLGERNHHYLLLLLARQRMDDKEKGLPNPEQGWVKKDLLVQMMGMVEQHINIQIYRFRKQVAKDLPHSLTLHQVIERRPGELRFAYSDIKIEGGFNLKNGST